MTLTKDKEIILRGYNPYPQIYKPSTKLVSLVTKLNKLDIAKKRNRVHTMELDEALYDASAFLDRYYNLHNIPLITNDTGATIVTNIHPYDLPLYEGEETDNIFSSSIIEDIISTPKPSINYIGINLAPTITEQTSTSYVHEITHSQLDHQIGVIKEFYHAEILSMFNELFHASILDSEENILRLNDSRRLYEMKILTQSLLHPSAFTREDLLLDSQYLISDLKAYNLFIKFYYGNETLKEEIISDIQSVFDGYMTVEDLLDKYNITLANSIDNKKLLKYFNR